MRARALFALAAGALFSLGLMLSGLTDPATVQRLFIFSAEWSPRFLFVLLGATLPMVVAWQVIRRRSGDRESPLVGGAFSEPSSQATASKLTPLALLGAVLFGGGWGAVGLCISAALVSLNMFSLSHMALVIAISAGLWLGSLVTQFSNR